MRKIKKDYGGKKNDQKDQCFPVAMRKNGITRLFWF